MTNLLILVRHSLPDMIKDMPAREWRLSQAGRSRAGHLAQRLAGYRPDRLVSSTEPKATETAEIVGQALALPVQVIENLHEHDRSSVPYLSKDEFESLVREFFLHPDVLAFGGETAEQACDRFSRAIESVLAQDKSETTAIVAHGTVISLFVSRFSGQAGFEVWRQLGLPGFIVLDFQSRKLIALENIT